MILGFFRISQALFYFNDRRLYANRLHLANLRRKRSPEHTQIKSERRIRLTVQPNNKQNMPSSFSPNSKNKNAQRTAAKAPEKEIRGMTKRFLTGFGIAVLFETVMENK